MKSSPIVEQGIAARLHAAIGFDIHGLPSARLRAIVNARCRQLHLTDLSAYATFLDQTPAEFEALIDQVVVLETRFFRDPVVFDHIRAAIAQLALANPGPLRILSAPCGTGEEAYSLAATLLLLGLPPSRFSIDAFDISQHALETARRGVYPERALHHVSGELQQATGRREGRHWAVHTALGERIAFARRNLAQPGALGETPQYHLILCRNLFIYLGPAARAALAKSLSTALLPGGRLFLGTADRVEELNALFAPMRPAASFGFVHRQAAAEPVQATAAAPVAPSVRRLLARLQGSHPPAPRQPAAPVDAEPCAANEHLQRALEHRQRGELAKAERRCRQALYLAPNLIPALELLQSLWDENPNLRHRRALRDRILRNRLAVGHALEETA